MTVEESDASAILLVIYTGLLDECLDFYASLGLTFVCERHGAGPIHYAAMLPGGMVIELYPAAADRVTCALRLGFAVRGDTLHPALLPGRHLREDPDGRTVEVHVS